MAETLISSVKNEKQSMGGRKSEVFIVAVNSGNSEGAKGHQYRNNKTRQHVPDTEPEKKHDNGIGMFHTDLLFCGRPNWEPDGLTIQVRFCEGRLGEIPAATLQAVFQEPWSKLKVLVFED